jgi:hypothetical protein
MPAESQTTFRQHSRLVVRRALKDFGWGRDLLISTAIAVGTAAIQLHWRIVASTDRKLFILSILAPYVLVFGVHVLWRFGSASWKVYQEREAELSETIAKIQAVLDEEIAKRDSPKLFLEYSSGVAADFLNNSGLIVRNCGKKTGL